ncbi:hypothetical protein FGIG_04816 [Fasciola gigantica]|uniref:Apple domain-containing protein n=1 Tax=Fasciola gigantica TaxID=46835 RepID=A0A504YUF0_FASGI|nr:hypothetical protein FGIG_04816 [Fasciola gigantica]
MIIHDNYCSSLLFLNDFAPNKRNARAIDCPPNFENLAGGICTIIQEGIFDFCSANDACHQMGLSRNLRVHLIGMNLTKIISRLKRSGSMYTSTIKLLRPDEGNRAGWHVGVPGQANFTTQGDEMDLWDEQVQPDNIRKPLNVSNRCKLQCMCQWGVLAPPAAVCKLEYRCRSFYFNSKLSKCYVTLYVDSLLARRKKSSIECGLGAICTAKLVTL